MSAVELDHIGQEDLKIPAIQNATGELSQVVMMQTADAIAYKPMLDLTYRINSKYCQRWGIKYEQYVGVKRGVTPWQATYNRIFMLHEILMRGFSGWIVYLDADAFMYDFDYDIVSYLRDNTSYCIIGAEGGEADWNINAGVIFINLADSDGRFLVTEWLTQFLALVPESYLNSPDAKWDNYPSDQAILHHVIQKHPRIHAKTKREPKGMFNYEGAVIKQAIRAAFSSKEQRFAWLESQVASAERKAGNLTLKRQPAVAYYEYFDLTDAANRHGSDKGDQIGNAHYYTNFYQFLFEGQRFDTFDFIEIGLLRGGPEVGNDVLRPVEDVPSVRMWLEFFPNATCHGVDISDFSGITLPRFHFHQADAGMREALLQVRDAIPQTRFVIDDGSHASFHQQLAFYCLFPNVEPGGVYIFEDLDWQPESYEPNLPSCRLTRDVMLDFAATGILSISFLSFKENQLLSSQMGRVYAHRRRGDGTTKLLVVEKRR